MAVASVAAPERHDAGDWYSVPDLSLRDHRFTVPLDYSAAAGSSITVFAREVVAVGKEEEQLPYLLYLQGGPGFESPRPTEASGWLKRACEEYRVVLLDQRGTGLSTPLTVSSLSQIMSATKLVEYLQHFRADNIIKDAEFLRSCLVPDSGTWTVLGQSYGGFCAVTYMSFAPEGLKSVLLTGGIPPIAKGCREGGDSGRRSTEMAEDAILGFLQTNDEIADSHQFSASVGVDHTELENVIKRLHGFEIVEAKDFKKDNYLVSEEGKQYALEGSPEVNFFLAVPVEGISLANLKAKLDPKVFSIGSSWAKKNGWIEIAKGSVTRKVENVEDKVKDLLKRIEEGKVVDGNDVADLSKRKLIVKQTWRGYTLRKGSKYVSKRKKAATDLTREHLQRGDWKDLEFKEYNLNAQGQPIQIGHLQPLLEVREEIQNIFLQMGFEEMPTNNFVESSFWNFDALFQPQQHPARDSHDTFFLKAPSTTRYLPEDYVERVKCVHESGGYGSKGYGYDWKREEAEKNLLRTHTTAVSTRMLYMLAQQRPFMPKRYYSIDRVFRNEAVDRTHLAEFHQIEGLICDHGLTLGDLIGVLEDFFARLGMSKLRFKPAYNPYTEPSMEIFSYHEGLKKWVEVGNSGMFRPEMLLPMGLPEDVNVIAWGLSLERPTMILYGIDNIRDLFGPKVDFNLIKSNPLCRLGLQ